MQKVDALANWNLGMTKEYSNNEVTVVWKPDLCIHSKKCWKELGSVFDPRVRPWIKMAGSDTDSIIAQVKICPSGALQYYMNAEQPPAPPPVQEEITQQDTRIEVTVGGPYLVKSRCMIVHADGTEEVKDAVVALCRCGASQKKPYCDGSHVNVQM